MESSCNLGSWTSGLLDMVAAFSDNNSSVSVSDVHWKNRSSNLSFFNPPGITSKRKIICNHVDQDQPMIMLHAKYNYKHHRMPLGCLRLKYAWEK